MRNFYVNMTLSSYASVKDTRASVINRRSLWPDHRSVHLHCVRRKWHSFAHLPRKAEWRRGGQVCPAASGADSSPRGAMEGKLAPGLKCIPDADLGCSNR